MRRSPWTSLAAAVLLATATTVAGQGPTQQAPNPNAAPAAAAAAPDGAALYQRRCASCHDNPTERTPPRQALQAMTSARILRVMDFGSDKYGLDAYLYDSSNDGRVNYDRVLFARDKDGSAAVGNLRQGQTADVKVRVSGGPKDGGTAGFLVTALAWEIAFGSFK